MSDYAHLQNYFAPVAIERPYALEAQLIAPFAQRGDAIAESLKAFHFAMIRTGDEREAMLCAFERMRDEIKVPEFRGPRRQCERSSRKARRKLVAALDRVILEGRGV